MEKNWGDTPSATLAHVGKNVDLTQGSTKKNHTCVLYAIYKGSMYIDVPLNSFVHRLI